MMTTNDNPKQPKPIVVHMSKSAPPTSTLPSGHSYSFYGVRWIGSRQVWKGLSMRLSSKWSTLQKVQRWIELTAMKGREGNQTPLKTKKNVVVFLFILSKPERGFVKVWELVIKDFLPLQKTSSSRWAPHVHLWWGARTVQDDER